jgi:integrase
MAPLVASARARIDTEALMAIGKPRGAKGARPVYVYDPRVGRKVYVGSRVKLRGPGGAQELEREKQAELAGLTPADPSAITIGAYAPQWLELHHGPRTRRPSPRTHRQNEAKLRPFVEEFGARAIDGGIRRGEALAWSKKQPHIARVVSAMFNDALDEELCKVNPFANRRQEEARGRRDIVPMTEQEVDRLARIALETWGEDGYGVVASAMILFGGWVGCRPGETFGVEQADLDFATGEVTIRRVKKRGNVYPTDVVAFPDAAQAAVLAIPSLPASGPIFRTITGRPITKGAHRYWWDAVRKGFERELGPARRAQLLNGRPDLDFYELRHFCASLLADRGASEFDIAHQLGNSPQVCRETYIHTHRDRTNDRNRTLLNGQKVVPLRRRMGSNGG